MIDPVASEIKSARIKLLMQWPLFAPLLLQMEPKEVEWCQTAATDGKSFYYNREFVKRLNREQLLFLTAHELLHLIYDHIYRRGNRDPNIWNIACDYIVNYTLLQSDIGQPIKDVYPIDDILYDVDYTDELSVDELYALLEKEKEKEKQDPDAGGPGPLDTHLDNGDMEDVKDDNGPPIYGQEELQKIRDMVRTSLIQGARQPNLDAGKIPLGIKRLLNRLLEHKIDWRQMLDSILRSSIKYDYTYLKRSRRAWTTNYILPGRNVMDKVHAVVFLDGSGSTTTEMVTDFLSECRGIMDTFKDFELCIGTFDTEVYNVKKFTPDNADEIDDYSFTGGGGTAPSCCWEYMKENEIVPHKLIIFTDGCVDGDWGEEDYCDTLFIVHSNPSAKAPYGHTVHYESRDHAV